MCAPLLSVLTEHKCLVIHAHIGPMCLLLYHQCHVLRFRLQPCIFSHFQSLTYGTSSNTSKLHNGCCFHFLLEDLGFKFTPRYMLGGTCLFGPLVNFLHGGAFFNRVSLTLAKCARITFFELHHIFNALFSLLDSFFRNFFFCLRDFKAHSL